MASVANPVPDNTARIPQHVAIIMDGNGRWAKKRLLPRAAGHRAGVGSVRKTVEACLQKGIGALTLFAFSSENWRRPQEEVSLLMELFLATLERETLKLHENGVRLRIIGDRDGFSRELRDKIAGCEAITAANTRLVLSIAANYGGRWDIAQAARALARRVAAGELSPDAINAELFHSQLELSDLPEPDLFIRTGGERRISNFLLWQLAYTELHFTPVLWPDFDERCFDSALDDYAGRQRRFGYTSEQLEGLAEAN